MTRAGTEARLLAAADRDARAKASVLPRVTFAAWHISDASFDRTARPVDVSGAITLKEAVDAALIACCAFHKDKFAILVADEIAGKALVHFYAIKRRSRPDRKWDVDQMRYVNQPHEYADPLFSMAVEAFVPKEPWRWTPDDPTGAGQAGKGTISQ